MWQEFLHRFFGIPGNYFDAYPIEYMIRYECTHFCFSAFTGFAVAWLLIQTISSQKHWKWDDRYIFLFSFWWGLFASILVHIIIDGFTTLA